MTNMDDLICMISMMQKVSKDKWNTKDSSKSLKNACSMPKVPLGLKRRRTVTKIKPVALAIIELHWSEGIRQLVSQSVSQ